VPAIRGRGNCYGPGDFAAAISSHFWHHRYVTSPLERLAQTAYDAHRAANPTGLPPWEDITKEEQQAWAAAVSAVAGQGGHTLTEASDGRPLVIQVGDQRHTFRTDFTAGREGNLAINDDFSSGHHVRFQAVRGLWYVEDLGSTNGTYLNGRRIHRSQLLKKRDKIRIGHTIMTVVST
jgi:pSer/pThr/pTyr-binding forkhead associated (FHA) protein